MSCYDTVLEAVSSNTDQCIIWPHALTACGYGQLIRNKKFYRAHKLVLTLKKGPPPTPEHQACHAPVVCHNTACINPKHLRWATRAENAADKVKDGTASRGEKQGQSKLTKEQILAIRSDTRKNEKIALEHKIDKSHVSRIKSRQTWAWLE